MGMDILGKLKWIISTLNWSSEKRSNWRLNRLGDIIEYCWNYVPFYREFWGDHGLVFRRPQSLDDLEQYPVLTKDIFKSNWVRIKSDRIKSIRHISKATSGSTGTPVKYYLDIEQWTFIQAFHQWGWSQVGYSFGDPVGIIAGYSLIKQAPKLRDIIRKLLERKLTLSGVYMDKSLALDYHRKLNIFGAHFLYGYPSVISLFASFLADKGLTLPQLKGIITTGEILTPQYRKNIENVFGCPVLDHYGSNDGGVMSYECHLHKGLHYNDLQSIIEVYKKNNKGFGRLLITNLWNKSMPFIRYENGDLVSLAKSPCACGQPFPLIESIEGRTTDIISLPNGRSLSGPALTLIFGNMDIDGWQVVQRSPTIIEVRILSRSGLKPEDYQYIKKVLDTHIGESVEVNIIMVPELECTKSGKLKLVWANYDQKEKIN
ncbi:MAG: phenylacetate--CoA ligase family protein [Candidatus Helarchaeota archaeon]